MRKFRIFWKMFKGCLTQPGHTVKSTLNPTSSSMIYGIRSCLWTRDQTKQREAPGKAISNKNDKNNLNLILKNMMNL